MGVEKDQDIRPYTISPNNTKGSLDTGLDNMVRQLTKLRVKKLGDSVATKEVV